MLNAIPSLALLSILPGALAAPAPVPVAIPAPAVDDAAALRERGLLGGILGGVGGVVGGVGGVVGGVLNGVDDLLASVEKAVANKDPAGINSALVKIVPPTRPSNVADAQARASSIWASPTGAAEFYTGIASGVAAGLGPLLDGTLTTVLTGGLPVGDNSIDNNNPPVEGIYPKKEDGDAPYSISEEELRKAIYIPSDFQYGAGSKRPIIMVPGTGSYGGVVFRNNLRKLLTGSSVADPVWLNIPGALLLNTQVNSEYVAYAINYISALCNENKENIALTSWSQGGLDTQWALKYWPSTRKVLKDFLPVSADFKGTILGNLICLTGDSDVNLPCAPSLIQQEATSNFIRTLRSGGGDSAYVPTTSFYSGFFDEVVQPQQGTGASAYMNDARNIGVLNIEVQTICRGSPAGGFYDHAGVLVHPLTYALIVDALTNDGPGSLQRIDVNSVCSTIVTPGLDLDDSIDTLGLIAVAGVSLLASPYRLITEPEIMSYAR